MQPNRQIIAYKNYFLDFYNLQSEDVQRKIEWTINLIKLTQRVPRKFFEHITGTKGLLK
jgi:hypothetical protein